jgi:hypothetical protein
VEKIALCAERREPTPRPRPRRLRVMALQRRTRPPPPPKMQQQSVCTGFQQIYQIVKIKQILKVSKEI